MKPTKTNANLSMKLNKKQDDVDIGKTVPFNSDLNSCDDDQFLRSMELFDIIKLKIDQLNKQIILQRQCINSIKTFESFLKVQLEDKMMNNDKSQKNIKTKLIQIKKHYEKFVKTFHLSRKRYRRIEIRERPSSEIYNYLCKLFDSIKDRMSFRQSSDPIESFCMLLNPVHINPDAHIVLSNGNEIQDDDHSKRSFVSPRELRSRTCRRRELDVKNLKNDKELFNKTKDQHDKKSIGKKGKVKKQVNSNLKSNDKKKTNVKKSNKIYYCDFSDCDYQTKSKFAMDIHGQKHSDERPFECETCHKSFKNIYRLKIHQLVHQNQRFHCPFEGCNAVYSWSDSLKKHILVHNNQAPVHQCDWPGCDYQSYRLDLLRKHRTRHTGERTFHCKWPDCGKAFKTRSVLFDHVSIHRNERKHACTWFGCNYRCNLPGNLRKHIAIHEKKLAKNVNNE
ncbi:hypothetical protein DERF_007135 [Dermatophagoides farinae]|uniref:C2H2-type domain-containing protein n=1 Tax=Dermatophagoides farinae TaxID=6954 RepID=A0A922HXK2_DERFA|nr:zinc finger protein 558-like isoform X2 [Dermatophagoides farinae]KAH9516396.1 hypothetical protein DERF_007135 [Dermatophagoides farinae]